MFWMWGRVSEEDLMSSFNSAKYLVYITKSNLKSLMWTICASFILFGFGGEWSMSLELKSEVGEAHNKPKKYFFFTPEHFFFLLSYLYIPLLIYN